MITKNHSTAYSELFKKAEEVLNKYSTDYAGVKISHIDDYFACLLELATIEREHPNEIDPIFTILPTTEQTFNIDADKRTISIPENFAKYGIGVQGDEIAEILYFSIDRYFDAVDLAEKDILIQWRHEKDAPGTQNLSATYKRSLTLQPGKIVFGWPISSDITANPGNIQFSVRFYEREGEDDKSTSLIYSFSTLTATIKIQSGLNFELSPLVTAAAINKNDQIYKNLRNSKKADLDYAIAKPEFIGYYIYSITADGDTESEVIEDVDLTQDLPVKFVVRGTVPKDAVGEVSSKELEYDWYYTLNKDKEPIVLANDQGTVTSEYIKVDTSRTGETYNPNEIYFENIGTEEAPQYKAYYISGDSNPFDDTDDEGNKITLYVKRSVCEPKKAGYFLAKVINNYRLGEYVDTESKYWYVPFAEEPVYTYENETKRALLDSEGKATIVINATVNDNGTINYQWYFNSAEDSFDGATPLSNANINTYNIDVTANNEEGWYFLKATNTKNNSESKNASDSIYVIHTPSIPEIATMTVNGNNWDGNSLITEQSPTLAIDIKDDLAYHTNFKYQWYSNNGATAIPGATSKSYKVTSSGNYICKVINTYKGSDSSPVASKTFGVSMA